MKLKYLLAVLVFAQCAGADQSGSQSSESIVNSDESILRTNAALKSYKEEYLLQQQNKAFAQSPDGHWNWRSDRVTVEMAKEDALAGCNRHTKKDGQACVIVNVNGEWVKPKQ
ncbi:MAG TPA: hypothetical protein PK002_00080 [Cellvibrio sp.]|nr:hypothetical protein [Cellvibrio sp.]